MRWHSFLRESRQRQASRHIYFAIRRAFRIINRHIKEVASKPARRISNGQNAREALRDRAGRTRQAAPTAASPKRALAARADLSCFGFRTCNTWLGEVDGAPFDGKVRIRRVRSCGARLDGAGPGPYRLPASGLEFSGVSGALQVRQEIPNQPRKPSSPIQRTRTGQLQFGKIAFDDRIEGPSKRTDGPGPCRDKHRRSRDGHLRRQATGGRSRRDPGAIQLPFGSFQQHLPLRQAARMLVSRRHDVTGRLKVAASHEKARRQKPAGLNLVAVPRANGALSIWRSRYIRGSIPKSAGITLREGFPRWSCRAGCRASTRMKASGLH